MHAASVLPLFEDLSLYQTSKQPNIWDFFLMVYILVVEWEIIVHKTFTGTFNGEHMEFTSVKKSFLVVRNSVSHNYDSGVL